MVRVADNGDVAVTYYDFTNDSPATPTLDTDYWTTRSNDGGATFHTRERITPTSFDMRAAPNAGGFFVGDYEGLASSGEFSTFFVGAHAGDAANPTDVFSTLDHSPFPTTTAPATRGHARVHRAAASKKAPGRLAHRARPATVR
jgi:hypothetical protein